MNDKLKYLKDTSGWIGVWTVLLMLMTSGCWGVGFVFHAWELLKWW